MLQSLLSRSRSPGATGCAALLVTLPAAGCGEPGAAGGFDALPLRTVEPEVRIGHVDDPDYAFTFVTGLELLPDGSILSLHAQEGLIRRWSPDGLPAGTVGRRGEGPGEFSRPQSMGWLGDTLWVMDLGNYRFNHFDVGGRFLGSVSLPVDLGTAEQTREGRLPPRPAAILRDGGILGRTPAFSQAIMEGRLTEVAFVRLDEEGAARDTLVIQPVGREGSLGVELPGGGGAFTTQPFAEGVVVERSADGTGLLVLERPAATEPGAAEFRLTLVDLAGDTVYSRGYPYTPVPLPRSTADSARDAQAESFHGWLGEQTGVPLGDWRRRVGEALHVPAHHPPVRSMVSGRDGTVWLALNPSPSPEAFEWLLLDAGGEPLARVEVPSGTRILAAERDRIWAVQQDELDVEFVVRFRVTEGGGAEAGGGEDP